VDSNLPDFPMSYEEAQKNALLQRPFLTIKETALVLDVSRWTVMRMLADGRISGQKVGRSKLIPTGQVRQLQETKRAVPASQGRFVQLSESQAGEIAKVLAMVLEDGFMPVEPAELIQIVRGHEHPGPVFWSSLVAGIERLRQRGTKLGRIRRDEET